MKKLILSISILLLSAGGWTQTEVCVSKIENLYHLLEERVNEVDNENPFEMKFRMSLVYNNGTKVDSTSHEAHVISDNSKRYFFTNGSKIYQNNEVTISIMDKTKEVRMFDTPPESYKNTMANYHGFLEDSLFKSVDNAVCKGNTVKLFFDEENKLANGLKEITFNLGGKQLVRSIQAKYYPGQAYSRIRVDYTLIDFNSKTKILSKELIANVMVGNQLVPQYKNYKLYDHRKNN